MINRKVINEYLLIILGCLMTALSFNFFFIPNEIAPGGLRNCHCPLLFIPLSRRRHHSGS